MEFAELTDFSEKVSNITIINLQDEAFMKELTNLFVKIGDVFSVCRLPRLDYGTHKRVNDLRLKKTYLKSKDKFREENNGSTKS